MLPSSLTPSWSSDPGWPELERYWKVDRKRAGGGVGGPGASWWWGQGSVLQSVHCCSPSPERSPLSPPFQRSFFVTKMPTIGIADSLLPISGCYTVGFVCLNWSICISSYNMCTPYFPEGFDLDPPLSLPPASKLAALWLKVTKTTKFPVKLFSLYCLCNAGEYFSMFNTNDHRSSTSNRNHFSDHLFVKL